MADETRQILAQQQQALVDALTRGSAVPREFDPEQIDRAAAALADKRLRAAQKAWPALSDALAERLAPLFRRYASSCPLRDGNPHADARAFFEFLLAQSDLSDAERLRLLPLRAAQGWPIRWFIGRGRCALAVRLWNGRILTWRTQTRGAE